MKRNAKKTDELLHRFLGLYGSPREEELESEIDSIWQGLQVRRGRQAKSAPTAAPDSIERFIRSPRKAFAASLIAASAAAVVIAVVVHSNILQNPTSRANTPVVQRALPVAESALSRVSMDQIESHQVFDSDGRTGSTLVLPDGSRVEMRGHGGLGLGLHVRTELSFERATDGLRIRLNEGSILVSAAKQRTGHLYVKTKDVAVSVVGTVFLVNAEQQGSRVAVIEGEVHVQKGATTERLLPGEQVATSSLMGARSLIEEISWSRNAEEHFAMLQQSPVPPTAAAEAADRFEVVSIRPSELPTGTGARGGGVSAGPPPPCLAANAYAIALQLELNQGRFGMKLLPLYSYIGFAYGNECPAPGALTGGPDWARTEMYDLQATFPAGTPRYTKEQLLSGNAPRLQRMLQNMLADRFKLVLKREVREMQGYNLVVAQEGKLKRSADQTPDQAPPAPGSGAGSRVLSRTPRIPLGTAPTSRLASTLQSLLKQPVIDKTGLTGQYDIFLEFPELELPEPPTDGAPPAVSPGERLSKMIDLLPSKLEATTGLRLERAKVPVEVLVIVSVEKPSPN
jgi:uncharacterized protein (TIGR03435 family)